MANLICYIGLFGTGKSYALISRAIELAESDKLMIVSNIWIDLAAYTDYCLTKGYKWALKCRLIYADLFAGKFVDIRHRKRAIGSECNITSLISDYPNSVIIFDEAGIHLNSRMWKDTGSDFLASLFQLRHDNKTLLCGYQFYNQVDTQLRQLIQLIIICTAIAPRDRTGQPRLKAFFRHHYEPIKYAEVEFKRPNALQGWLWALKVDFNFLPITGLLYFLRHLKIHPQFKIFDIYSSFSPSAGRRKILHTVTYHRGRYIGSGEYRHADHFEDELQPLEFKKTTKSKRKYS